MALVRNQPFVHLCLYINKCESSHPSPSLCLVPLSSSCLPQEYGDLFIKVAEEVATGLMDDMGAELLAHNTAPRLSVDLVELGTDLLRNHSLR